MKLMAAVSGDENQSSIKSTPRESISAAAERGEMVSGKQPHLRSELGSIRLGHRRIAQALRLSSKDTGKRSGISGGRDEV